MRRPRRFSTSFKVTCVEAVRIMPPWTLLLDQASACDDADRHRSMRDLRPALSPDAARASLLASTALSATYPVAAKLIYAADGVALSPTALTWCQLRFSLMAICCNAAVLSCAPAVAKSQAPRRPARSLVWYLLLNVNADDESDTKQGFWLAAAELGFWATAGAQLNTAALQQISVVRGTILLASINILTPALDYRPLLAPRKHNAVCLVARGLRA